MIESETIKSEWKDNEGRLCKQTGIIYVDGVVDTIIMRDGKCIVYKTTHPDGYVQDHLTGMISYEMQKM